MKKIFTILGIVAVATVSAQTPVITMIADCDCTGGTPKVLEIYANGTVDFSQYTLQNQTNANTTWGTSSTTSLSLSALGTLTNTFAYVYYDASNDNFFTEFPTAIPAQSIEHQALNLNGDDRVRIINTTTQAVIDQWGVSDTDGSGTTWETTDSYAKRNNSTGPDGGFTQANWTIAPLASLDGQGVCQSGTAFGTIIGAGTYQAAALSVSDITSVKSNFVRNTMVNNEINFGTKADVKVYNMNGQVVKSASVSENNNLEVSDLAPGMYIVTGTVNGEAVSQKILKK